MSGRSTVIVITFLAPLVAKFALRFGPAEFFSVQFLTFASFIGMGRGSPFKTIAAMCLGFALASVGLDTVTGQLRMTYGFTELLKGFGFLIAVIGLFGIGEMLNSIEEGLEFKGADGKLRLNAVLKTWAQLPRYWITSIRSCLIGCWMGITPGGATPASFMSYGLAKRFSRNGDNFGKGTIDPNGRKRHDAYLFEVKKPSESKGPWDFYKLRATIPADQAFQKAADAGCPLVK